MIRRESRRQELTTKIARYLLETGLPGASLRPLAAACDTSDRMLLYYFDDKEDLLRAALFEVAAGLQGVLDAGIAGRKPASKLVPEIRALLSSPAIRPYMQLWLEIAARAARSEEPFRSVSKALCAGYQAFIASHLTGAEAHRDAEAARLLPLIEGWVLLDTIGFPPAADSARREA